MAVAPSRLLAKQLFKLGRTSLGGPRSFPRFPEILPPR
jgi:hypothetical protein